MYYTTNAVKYFIVGLRAISERYLLHTLPQYIPTAVTLLAVFVCLFYVQPIKTQLNLTPALSNTVFVILSALSLFITLVYVWSTRQRLHISLNLIAPVLLFTALTLTTYAITRDWLAGLFGYANEPGTLLFIAAFFSTILISALGTTDVYKRKVFQATLFYMVGVLVTLLLLIPLLKTANFHLLSVYSATTLHISTVLLIVLSLSYIERPHLTKAQLLSAYFFLLPALIATTTLPPSYVLVALASVMTFSYLKLTYPPLFFANQRLPFTSLLAAATLIICLIIPLRPTFLDVDHLIRTNSLTFSESVSVIQGIYRHSAMESMVGVGANNFRFAWSEYKPIEVNNTSYWNDEFNSARTYLLNVAAEHGIVGTAAFVLFILTIGQALFILVQKEKNLLHDNDTQLVITLFVFSLASIMLAKPTAQTLLLVAVCLGIAAGTSGLISTKSTESKRSVALVKMSILLILVITAIFFTITNARSVLTFERSMIAATKESDSMLAMSLGESAVEIVPKPLYYRSLAQMYHQQIEVLINKEGEITDTDRENLRILATLALRNIQSATDLEDRHYLNWYTLGQIQTTLYMLGALEAGQEGIIAYERAATLAPRNALVLYAHGELAFLTKDIEKAKALLQKSIAYKPYYQDANALLTYIWNQN